MAAIGRPIVMLAAEVAGYSRLTRADEKGTLEQLEAHRDQFVYPKIAEHSGRIVRAIGDCLVVEFESPTEAVRCAVELQCGMIDRNIRKLPGRRITFRVGVSVGQVTGNGDDLVSRAVAALPRDTLATLIKPGSEIDRERGNMAVRLAGLAEPAGICISDAVQDAIRDQLPYMFKDIGKRNLEIRAAPVHCYAMNADGVASVRRFASQKPRSRPVRLRSAAIAVSAFATVGLCGVAVLMWLGTNSSTAVIPAPVTAGSHVPPVGITADEAAPASSPRQSPPMSSAAAATDNQAPPASQIPLANGTVAVSDPQAPWAAQPSLASNNAAVERSSQVASPRPAPSEIGVVVVRGKQAPALQTTPDDGTAALGGIQAPAVLQTTMNSGVAVVRGNQAPSTLQIGPEADTDVVRGTRVISGPPLSSRPDQR
jgi:class 3 adenylate cyclase